MVSEEAKFVKQEIIYLRLKYPNMTLSEIGVHVHRTKERVRQILALEGLETRSAKQVFYRGPKHLKQGPPCHRCNKPTPYKGSYLPYKYCSKQCRSALLVTHTCNYCSKNYILSSSKSRVRHKRIALGIHKGMFCSQSCRTKAYWDAIKGNKPNIFKYKPPHRIKQS